MCRKKAQKAAPFKHHILEAFRNKKISGVPYKLVYIFFEIFFWFYNLVPFINLSIFLSNARFFHNHQITAQFLRRKTTRFYITMELN